MDNNLVINKFDSWLEKHDTSRYSLFVCRQSTVRVVYIEFAFIAKWKRQRVLSHGRRCFRRCTVFHELEHVISQSNSLLEKNVILQEIHVFFWTPLFVHGFSSSLKGIFARGQSQNKKSGVTLRSSKFAMSSTALCLEQQSFIQLLLSCLLAKKLLTCEVGDWLAQGRYFRQTDKGNR